MSSHTFFHENLPIDRLQQSINDTIIEFNKKKCLQIFYGNKTNDAITLAKKSYNTTKKPSSVSVYSKTPDSCGATSGAIINNLIEGDLPQKWKCPDYQNIEKSEFIPLKSKLISLEKKTNDPKETYLMRINVMRPHNNSYISTHDFVLLHNNNKISVYQSYVYHYTLLDYVLGKTNYSDADKINKMSLKSFLDELQKLEIKGQSNEAYRNLFNNSKNVNSTFKVYLREEKINSNDALNQLYLANYKLEMELSNNTQLEKLGFHDYCFDKVVNEEYYKKNSQPYPL
jgi:hypothetical protein